MDDEEEDDDEDDDDSISEDDYDGVGELGDHVHRRPNEPRTLRELIEDYCHKLFLAYEIPTLSLFIAQKLSESDEWSDGHTEWCIVAVSIYIASSLSGEPRSPRQIHIVSAVGEDHIRSIYGEIYPHREQLADADMLSLLSNTSSSDAYSLNWPTRGSELIDAEIEGEYMPRILRQGCEEGCNELGLDARIAEFSNVIAERIYNLGVLLHPRAIIGAGILVASSCLGNSTVTFNRVAETVSTSTHFLRSACQYAYGYRDGLMTEELLCYVNRDIMEAVITDWSRL